MSCAARTSPAVHLHLVMALLLTATACDARLADPEPVEPVVLDQVVVVEGDGQSGQVASELPVALAVRLLDTKGRAMPGVSVEFTVASGGGSLAVGTSVTDQQGEARTRWTLGVSIVQEQRVDARAVDPETGAEFTVGFDATPLPGPAVLLAAVGGVGQAGVAGRTLSHPLVVVLEDAWGNPIAGTTVTWTVVNGGGSVSPESSITDEGGRASTEWTLGETYGVQQVLASAATGQEAGISANSEEEGWESLSPLPNPVRAPAVATDGERIYVMGGNAGAATRTRYTQIYHPVSRTWVQGAEIPVAVEWASAAYLADGVHLVGGVTDQAAAVANHWIYDPDSDKWSAGPAMPRPHAGATAQVLDGRIYVVGGIDAPSHHAAYVHVYYPDARIWSSAASLPSPRINLAGGVVDGRLLSAGGSIPGRVTLTELVSYDPATNVWSRLPDAPTRREGHGAGVVGLKYCVVGGRTTPASGSYAPPYSGVECFDTQTLTWTSVRDLPQAVEEVGAVGLDGYLYAFGGRISYSGVTGQAVRKRF